MYQKRIQIFTIALSSICSILILATPYRMDIYYWTCDKMLYWFLTSIFPLIFLSLIIIIISSILMNRKLNLRYEKLVIAFSIIGSSGTVLGDRGQPFALLCGPSQTIFLPTAYLALAYFLFMSIWASILLTKKKELLKNFKK